jgi:acetoin utilization deacetylase AcuC-like enzyme
LYPGTGDLEEIGSGAGQGYTVNMPLPPYTGDQGFRTVMDELILPLLDRFAPEMLLISAGFDPHWRDPLGYLALSAQGYGELMARLAHWADQNCAGKLAVFLEGGYDLEAGAACARAWTAALLGLPWQDPMGPSLRPESSAWQATLRTARQIWEV